MATILENIITKKTEEVAFAKSQISIEEIQATANYHRSTYSLIKNLENTTKIIAEFKRQSPSKGIIHANADANLIGTSYEKFGASAISVLTDSPFFGGSYLDFSIIRSLVECPMLRKDFMIDEYQFHEAKALGADVVLLIAACLSKNQVQEFAQLANELGMEVLLEVHTEEECEFYNKNIQLVGINNRNLKDFKVDWQHSLRLKEALPKGVISVAESGISNHEDFMFLKENGFDAFLMGEIFMKEKHPEKAFEEFTQKIKKLSY